MKISPAIKGIITALLMTGIILMIYNMGKDADPRLQYLVYVIYAIGIVWTLVAFRQSPAYTGTFGNLFSQGFKCFVVVTLIMALFYGIFNYSHPEFAEESAMLKKELLLAEKNSSRTPNEIEEEVRNYKKGYNMAVVYGSIFGYLIIGVAVTAAISAFLMRRKD